MIGILIITHGSFSRELLSTAELIMGKQKSISALELNHNDDISRFKDYIQLSANNLDTGHGLLVLTDVFGGSPYNLTAALMKTERWESLTGVNLPMLMEAINSRESCDLNTLVQKCYVSGV